MGHYDEQYEYSEDRTSKDVLRLDQVYDEEGVEMINSNFNNEEIKIILTVLKAKFKGLL